jgi:hypothetical protein
MHAHRVQCDVDEMLAKKKNWSEPTALTSTFSVELPGIEPDALPGLLPLQLPFRSVSFRFSPVRYLRLRFSGLDGVKSRMGASSTTCSAAGPPPET